MLHRSAHDGRDRLGWLHSGEFVVKSLELGAEPRVVDAELVEQRRMQIAHMDELLTRKRWMGAAYRERLSSIAALELQEDQPWARPMYWMFGLVLRDDVPMDAKDLSIRLAARGIETRPFFLGMHEQPAFLDDGLFVGERYPVAERIARRGLYLPSGLGLTEIQLERVCDAVREILA